jgi:chitinase
MIKYRSLILSLVIFLISGQIFGKNKEIIGCYRYWDWKRSPEVFAPENIPYNKLTIINYCFFYPLENGEIVGMDPAADRYLLKGEGNSGGSMISLANTNGTKVLLSIGGWETSDNFPQVSADPAKRANFAHWCIKHIQQYGFDGIDIDWEFPGYKQHKGTEQDRENFNLLLQTVHDSLRALENKSGEKYLLTVSLPAAASHLSDIDVQTVSSIADYINIMTYDLFGPWGKISNHNSALYGPAQGDSARCLDGAFKLYHDIHKAAAEKINLCAAFFGYSYTDCNKIYGEHKGADTTLFPAGMDIFYSQISEKMDQFEHHWDAKAQAPYLVGKLNNTLISFDDEKSVALKAEYVIKNNAAGIIIWPLMGDYLDGETPLLDVIHQKFFK